MKPIETRLVRAPDPAAGRTAGWVRALVTGLLVGAALPAMAQLRRGSIERPDVYEFAPPLQVDAPYARGPGGPKTLADPDFFCTQCARERRIPYRTWNDASSKLRTVVTYPYPVQGVSERSHGDFRLMEHDGEIVLDFLFEKSRSRRPIYIEDSTFRLYTDLDGFSTRKFPYPRREIELRQLARIFPEISEKTVKLTAHHRAHLYLIRAHRVMRDFVHLVEHRPDASYIRFLGPYLGLKQKFEIYIFPKQRLAGQFMNTFLGHPLHLDGECWHTLQDDSMVAIMHAENLHDVWLNNTFTHRLAVNLLQGFRGYQYDLPAWLLFGFGHLMERRERTDMNTFIFGEGRQPSFSWGQGKWKPAIRKMVAAGKVRPLVELAALTHPSDITAAERGVIWSLVSYQIQEHGNEKFARLVKLLKQKQPGESLHELQTRAYRSAYDLTLLELFEGWKQWVLSTYPKF